MSYFTGARLSSAFAIAMALALWPSSAAGDVIDPSPEDEEVLERPFEPFDERRYGLAVAQMLVRYARVRDPDALRGASDLLIGGISARALYGKRACYGFGLGLELGASRAAGFAFAFDLFPSGFAIAFGETGYVGAFFGLRVDGVTGRVPFVLTLPSELRVEVDVTRRLRLGALFGMAWAPATSARNAGTFIPSIDETIMAFTGRIGRTFPRFGATYERGYFVRLERREQMQTVLYGLAVGAEVGAAD